MIVNDTSTAMPATTVVLFITALSTALTAGLFYAYSCSVIPGLGQLPDKEYLLAMQSINCAILNPLFFAGFVGALLLMPCSAWLLYRQPGSNGAFLLLCAWLLYAAGVFGVTMMGNVPLNKGLAAFDIKTASVQGLSHQRTIFEKPWNRFHRIRTIASVASLVLVIIACLRNSYA